MASPTDGHEFEQASGVGDGQGSLVSCSLWVCKESDMTEWLNWTELLGNKSLATFSNSVYSHRFIWIFWTPLESILIIYICIRKSFISSRFTNVLPKLKRIFFLMSIKMKANGIMPRAIACKQFSGELNQQYSNLQLSLGLVNPGRKLSVSREQMDYISFRQFSIYINFHSWAFDRFWAADISRLKLLTRTWRQIILQCSISYVSLVSQNGEG